MYSKLLKLLESKENRNLELAIQIIMGQKAQEPFNSLLFGIALFHPQSTLRRQARQCFQLRVSSDLYEFLLSQQEKNLMEETEIELFLRELKRINGLELVDIARLLIQYRRKGVRFCLEEKVLKPKEILSILVQEDWLSLENFELRALPPEIGEFQHLRSIHLGGNCFQSLPREFNSLCNLEHIYLGNTPLKERTLRKLKETFPKIFADKYYMKAIGSFEERNYQEALHFINQSLYLNPKATNSLNTKGLIFQRLGCYEDACNCFQKALHIKPNEPQIWSNLALTQLEFGKYESALKASERGIKESKKDQKIFQKYLDTLFLLKGQSLAHLEKYEESLASFEYALKMEPNSGDAHYQKAKVYSRLNRIPEAINNLKRSLEVSRRFVYQGQNDPVLKTLFNQQEIKSLIRPRKLRRS